MTLPHGGDRRSLSFRSERYQARQATLTARVFAEELALVAVLAAIYCYRFDPEDSHAHPRTSEALRVAGGASHLNKGALQRAHRKNFVAFLSGGRVRLTGKGKAKILKEAGRA